MAKGFGLDFATNKSYIILYRVKALKRQRQYIIKENQLCQLQNFWKEMPMNMAMIYV